MPAKLPRHGDWVHAAYIRWLERGGPDVWMWLTGRNTRTDYPLSSVEQTRIRAVRRLIADDGVSEREVQR